MELRTYHCTDYSRKKASRYIILKIFFKKSPPKFFQAPYRGRAKIPLYLENFRAFGPVNGRNFLPSTLPVARKMVENGINDRKIGHFPPSKCRKNQRQNPGGGVL
jgi:hypothetical protein